MENAILELVLPYAAFAKRECSDTNNYQDLEGWSENQLISAAPCFPPGKLGIMCLYAVCLPPPCRVSKYNTMERGNPDTSRNLPAGRTLEKEGASMSKKRSNFPMQK